MLKGKYTSFTFWLNSELPAAWASSLTAGKRMADASKRPASATHENLRARILCITSSTSKLVCPPTMSEPQISTFRRNTAREKLMLPHQAAANFTTSIDEETLPDDESRRQILAGVREN